MPYLSVCAMYRDEASYLPEWIEFHRLVGVERFFLYDNLSVDDHRTVLAPYIADGTVVLHDWPLSYLAQIPAYEHCLDRYRDDSRWIAFLDLDEFLFSPTGLPVSDVLRDYEEFPGVTVSWAFFGTSGHRVRPNGLVTENYTRRLNVDKMGEGQRWFHKHMYMKSVVDPRRTDRCETVHYFSYTDGTAVDENKRPVDAGHTDSPSYERLRINHYYTKSAEEFALKVERPGAADGIVRGEAYKRLRYLDRFLNETPDETIMSYVPALREALSTRS